MKVEELLARLNGVVQSGDHWRALCPAHADTTPSLDIKAGPDRILVHCFAGCEPAAILRRLGLVWSDLFQTLTVEALAAYKKLPVDFLRELGLRDHPRGGVAIPYYRRDGTEVAIKHRTALRARDGSFWSKGIPLHTYGDWKLSEADGSFLLLLEGDSDAWTAWYHRFPGLGLPGADAAKTLQAHHVHNVRGLWICKDADVGGEKFVRNIARRLRTLEWNGELRVITMPEGVKDLSDLHSDDPGQFPARFRAAIQQAAPVALTDTAQPSGSVAVDADEAGHLSDLGNAKRLVARHGNNLHYCYAWGKWLGWDGRRWAQDNTGEAERLAKDTVLAIYQEAAAAPTKEAREALAEHALRSEHHRRIAAMIALAESEPGIPITPGELDSDAWLLNVQNGTLDLRTGALRAHQREDLITKLAPVQYDSAAACPTWEAFLDRIMAQKPELIDYLRRAVGYALTGDTREQVLLLLYGTGANGKTTFVETLRTLLGPYAASTPTETLLAKDHHVIPNDLARLVGVRLVVALEADEHRRLAEGLVKQLTGQDTVTARFLYKEFFEFQPVFKVFIVANHKPLVRGVDHALWRRLRLVPFEVRIPDDEQDKAFGAKLKRELPGILAWAVRGCLEWQERGLGASEPVKAATAAYQEEMDILAAFLTECCVVDPQVTANPSELYAAYVVWAERAGEHPLSQTKFGMRLSERGYAPDKEGKSRLRRGLRLTDEARARGSWPSRGR